MPEFDRHGSVSAGWFRPVHVKTPDAREQRALLSARSTLFARLRDIENSLRGLLRGFGLRIPRSLGSRWEGTVRDCLEGHAVLLAIFEPLLAARRALQEQLGLLDARVRETVRMDPVCRRLMTAPGVGPVVALTSRAAVDRPERFGASRQVGAHFGLTPRRYQSGKTDRAGTISRAGDASVRVAVRGGACDPDPRQGVVSSEVMGHGRGPPTGGTARQGRAGPQARGGAPPDVGRRRRLPPYTARRRVIPSIITAEQAHF